MKKFLVTSWFGIYQHALMLVTMSLQKNFATSLVRSLSQLCRSYKARQDAILLLYNTFCDKRDKHFSDILFCFSHFLYWVRKSFIHQIVSITIFQVKYKNWNTIKSLPWKTLSQLSQFFFEVEKWRNNGVYETQKVRQASWGVCRTLSQEFVAKKKLCNLVWGAKNLSPIFYLVCERKWS